MCRLEQSYINVPSYFVLFCFVLFVRFVCLLFGVPCLVWLDDRGCFILFIFIFSLYVRVRWCLFCCSKES